MKALEKTYVIVKIHGSSIDYIQNIVSFSMSKLSVICDEMNDSENEILKEKLKNTNLYTNFIQFYQVLNLKDALKQLEEKFFSENFYGEM